MSNIRMKRLMCAAAAVMTLQLFTVSCIQVTTTTTVGGSPPPATHDVPVHAPEQEAPNPKAEQKTADGMVLSEDAVRRIADMIETHIESRRGEKNNSGNMCAVPEVEKNNGPSIADPPDDDLKPVISPEEWEQIEYHLPEEK